MDPNLTGPLSEAAEVVTMPAADALEKFKQYAAALRVSRSQHDRMMKSVFHALSEGLGVINPRAAIAKAGLDNQHHPKLAICRADCQTVFFRRSSSGDGTTAFFSDSARFFLSNPVKSAQAKRRQFYFSPGILPSVPHGQRTNPGTYWEVVKATVPIVPPQHRPDSSLDKFSILWEVEKWEALPRPQRPPGDPMLLKPLAQTGLYAVMAHWDLTDIEKMVLGAMYGN